MSVDCVTVDSFHADPVGETDYLDRKTLRAGVRKILSLIKGK